MDGIRRHTTVGRGARKRARVAMVSVRPESWHEQRVRRIALLLTLLRPVRSRRPISLPNTVRLYRRWASNLARLEPDVDLDWIAGFYRREQPFREANWQRRRQEVNSSRGMG